MEISADGRVIRSHPIKHDPAKEHGALSLSTSPTVVLPHLHRVTYVLNDKLQDSETCNNFNRPTEASTEYKRRRHKTKTLA